MWVYLRWGPFTAKGGMQYVVKMVGKKKKGGRKEWSKVE